MRAAGLGAWRRVRSAWLPVALASLAAALSWLIAHRVLGHSQPFFAPIAAAIALSTSRIQRSIRIAQMVSGVLLGIAIGELLVAALGSSTVALGVIVFATMIAAVLIGAGFFSQGVMFANQAAASAILVVTLRRQGLGGERAVDALVGGAVALVLGVLLFPVRPLSLLRDAERSVLKTLAGMLQRVADLLAAGRRPREDSALRAAREIHHQLGALARARTSARTAVRVAPRRWHLRSVVDAETERTAQLDLLANAVLGLLRAATVEFDQDPLPRSLQRQISELGGAIGLLAQAPQPWPPQLRADVAKLAASASEHTAVAPAGRSSVVGPILRAAARDLSRVIETTA
jgi:uncharacterized membrane protein YgaE (UPF0421/DUF939 family)